MGVIQSRVVAAPVAERKLRRDVGLVGLLFA